MLSKPIVNAEDKTKADDKIIIIEASANMRAARMTEDGYKETRFERAINKVKELSEEVLSDDQGSISVILAGKKAETKVQTSSDLEAVVEILDGILENDECTYNTADISGAMDIAEELLQMRPDAEVMLYTATEYYAPGDVTVVNVREDDEWNAAILGVTAELNAKKFYTFTVEVGLYGIDGEVELAFEVYNVDAPSDAPGEGRFVSHTMVVDLEGDKSAKFSWDSGESVSDEYETTEGKSIMIFNYADIYIKRVNEVEFDYAHTYVMNDSIDEDNRFVVYGERKKILRVEYVSTLPNPFVRGMIDTWRSEEKDDWEIWPKEVYIREDRDVTPEYEGYHIYIFEHMMPTTMPQDGLVIILDPPEGNKSNRYVPSSWAIRFGSVQESSTNFKFEKGTPHKIISSLKESDFGNSDFGVRSYTPISSSDPDFEELLYIGDSPALLLKDNNDDGEKIVIFSYNVHFSNPLSPQFGNIMMDIFEYFFPGTISNYLYRIGETVTFNSIGSDMLLIAPGLDSHGQAIEKTFREFPASYVVEIPGSYTLKQQFLGTMMETRFFVQLPEGESNTMRVVDDALEGPIVNKPDKDSYLDLLIYLAAALVVLLFAEWFLQSRSQM